MDQNTKFKAGLYLRLSKEDDGSGDSVSIGTQRAILTEFCQSHQYEIGKIYIDDGYSGLNFSRPGFLEMLCDIENSLINMVVTKDLSRLGRDYTGVLVSLKTESINCKTKQRIRNAVEDRIVTSNAHQAIISAEQFARIKHVREGRACPANTSRFNLFRGKLFCECCGHPLTISRKELKDRVTDIYLCMYHYAHPDVCSQTHRVYHDVLYPYVLQQVQSFAKSMRRRKVNSPIKDFADIEELTPEILDATIERIEIGHVKYRSKPGSVIHIYWKLK